MKKLFYVLIFCFLMSIKNGETTNMRKISEFSNINQAIESAEGKDLIIDKKVEVEGKILIPKNVHLFVTNEGGFIKKKGTSAFLSIEGNFTAPLRQIFFNFSPGEVKLNPLIVKECYPIWWGADQKGEIDASDAIQSAIDSGCSKIYLHPGNYLLEKPLNMTHKIGLVFEGASYSEFGTPSVLIGNTGGIVIDASGSRYLRLQNFAIEKGKTHPSEVGIYFARTDKIQFSEFNYLEKVRIALSSNPEANNGHGTVGIYNYASELWRATDIYIIADNCVVFTGYNIFNIHSPYANTKPQYPSMSEAIIDGISTLTSIKGSNVIIDNGIAIKILNAYFSGRGETPENSYAIRIEGTGFWGSHIEITGHIERKGGILYTSANLTNIKIDISSGNRGPLIFINKGSINDSELRIMHFERVSRKREFFAKESIGSISNTTFYVEYPEDEFNAPNLKLLNCIFRGNIPFNILRKNVCVQEGSTFIIIGNDKMDYIKNNF